MKYGWKQKIENALNSHFGGGNFKIKTKNGYHCLYWNMWKTTDLVEADEVRPFIDKLPDREKLGRYFTCLTN